MHASFTAAKRVGKWSRRAIQKACQPRLEYLFQVELLEMRRLLSTFQVTSTGDSPTTSGTLPWAILQADAAGSGNQYIDFSLTPPVSGPSTITLTGSPLVLDDTSGGTVVISGPGAQSLVVNGNNLSSVFVIDADSKAEIDGLTITNGNGSYGGGIEDLGTLTINNAVITGNTSATNGGGIDAPEDHPLNVYNSKIEDNYAEYGGGVWGTELTISNSVISGNTADGNTAYAYYIGGGGGVSGEGIITDSKIIDNTAGYGGGIEDLGSLTVTNCTISGNISTQNGGGIWNYFGYLTVADSTISGNTSGNYGGGISNGGLDNYGTTTVSNSTITGNTALLGGGIYSYSGSNLYVTDATVVNNSAADGGGGISAAASLEGTFDLLARSRRSSGMSTRHGMEDFSDGFSDSFEGDYDGISINDLNGTIVAENATGGDLAGTFSGTYNLIGDGTGGLSSDFADHNILGTSSALIDPMLFPLGSYWGTTDTMPPLPNSPAINNGSTFDVSGSAINTDQRGVTRPLDNYADIGAVETTGLFVEPTSIDSSALTSSQIILEYGGLPGQQLDLQEAGPSDLNYHTIASLPNNAAGPALYTVSGLESDSHYSFRLATISNNQVQYWTAFADTDPASGSLSLPAPTSLSQGATVSGAIPVSFGWNPSSDSSASSGFTVNVREYSDMGIDPLFNYNASDPGTPSTQTFSIPSSEYNTNNEYTLDLSFPSYIDQIQLQISDGTNVSSWTPLLLKGISSPPTTPVMTLSATVTTGSSVEFSLGAASTADLYGITADNTVDSLGSFAGSASLTLADSSIPSSVQEVIAFDGTHYSPIVALPNKTPMAPAAPTNLTITQKLAAGIGSAYLQWDDNTDNETDYIIQREDLSGSSASWEPIATLGPDQNEYNDTLPNTSDVYDYQVIAVGSGGNSQPSNTVLVWFAPLVSAIAINPQPSLTEAPITFSISAAPENNNGDSLSYVWSLTDPSDHTTTHMTTVPTLTLPLDSAGNWSVSVVVTDVDSLLATTVAPQAITVATGPAVQIAGPTLASEGQLLSYSESGLTSDIAWAVTHNSSEIASGSGSTFTFTPSDSGTYTLAISGDDASADYQSASASITVAYTQPNVTIEGPGVGFAGNAQIFGVQVEQTPGVNDSLAYQWELLNGNGSAYNFGSVSAPDGTSSSYVVPGSLAPGSYQVQVTVSDTHDDTVTPIDQTFAFSILSAPLASNFNFGIAPSLGSTSAFGVTVDAVLQQSNGQIVIAGHQNAYSYEDSSDIGGTSFLARFNSDMTLDTSFGPYGNGIAPVHFIPAADSTGFGQGVSYIYAMAFNPVNNDIVVTGETWQIDGPFDTWTLSIGISAAVEEFVTTPTITSAGQLILPGEPDPSFNDGNAQILGIGTGTSSAGFKVIVNNDGSILIGGVEQTAEECAPELAADDEPYRTVDDFLLFKLTPSGQLDKTFGTLASDWDSLPANEDRTGIAEQPDLTGVASLTPFFSDPSYRVNGDEANGIFNLILESDGDILAGGDIDADDSNPYGSLGNGDVGFALVLYNPDGTIDTGSGFGTDGKVFTDSSLLNDGGSTGLAAFSSMELLSDNDVLAVGVAESTSGGLDNPHVVLVEYNGTTGDLDSDFASGGVDTESALVDKPNAFSPFVADDDVEFSPGYQSDSLTVAFQSDEKVVVSMETPSNSWIIFRLNTDGSVDDTFGSTSQINIPQPLNDNTWSFVSSAKAGALLLDNGNVIVAGTLSEGDNAVAGYPLVVPLIVRINSEVEASASDLTLVSQEGGVALSWQNTGYDEDGFIIERSTTLEGLSDAPVVVASVESTQDDYVDSSAAADTTYYYEVVPFYANASGGTDYGTATSPQSVHTYPENVSYVLQGTVSVPITGDTADSPTLESGQTYLLVVSGMANVSDQTIDGAISDAGYLYPSIQMNGDPADLEIPQNIASVQTAFPIQTLTSSSGIATADLNYDYDFLIAGEEVEISGADQSQYDGVFLITSATDSSIKFTVPSGTPSSTMGANMLVTLIAPVLQIGSVTCTGTTATATTEGTNSFSIGQRVVISGVENAGYDGVYSISEVSADTFSFSVNSSLSPSTGGYVEAFIPSTGINDNITWWQTPTAITSLAASGTTATATVGSTNPYAIGDEVYITGVDQNQYDGLFTVTGVTGSTFSYAVPSGTPATATGSDMSAQQMVISAAGVGIGPDTDNIIPQWGLSNPYTDMYTYAIVGTGEPLTFQFHDGNYSLASLSTDGQPLEVQIYAVASDDITPPSDTNPVMEIVSPANSQNEAIPPVISDNTPVRIVSANPDGSATPWALWLVSSTSRFLLASSDNSAGQLPNTPAAVCTLNPSLYMNGVYALELTSSLTDPAEHVVATEQISINTAAKTGNLQLPVTDASLNTPVGAINVTRTYNSLLAEQSLAGVATAGTGLSETLTESTGLMPNAGAGWSFSLLDTQMTTTAQLTDSTTQFTYISAGIGAVPLDTPVFRAGDLISFTVPDGGEHVFEFDPQLISESFGTDGSLSSIEYIPRFVAIDGSGSTLTLPYLQSAAIQLSYDPVAHDFIVVNLSSESAVPSGIVPDNDVYADNGAYNFTDVSDAPFFPAGLINGGSGQSVFSGEYQLTTGDGTSYIINANTGLILSVTNTSGDKITYHYPGDAGGPITATDAADNTILSINTDSAYRVTSIQVPGQSSIEYTYDSSGNLISVENQLGNITTYFYQDSDNPHALTGVMNSGGQTILQAQYDSTTGQLLALVNAQGVVAPIVSGALGNNQALQTIADTAGDITENVIDERYGDILRKIQVQTDDSGITDYIVTVQQVSYVRDDVAQMSDLDPSGVVLLQGVEQFAPFEITGSDAAGLRFSAEPAADSWITQTIYDTSNNPDDAAFGQVLSMSTHLVDDGSTLQTQETTLDSNYAVVNSFFQIAKPQLVTVEIQTVDSSSPTGFDNQVQSQTYYSYNSAGEQGYSLTVNALNADTSNYPDSGVFSDLGEGNFPEVLYVVLSGLSNSGADGFQELTWNSSTGMYAWSDDADSDSIELQLQDTSLTSSRHSPILGDSWTLWLYDAGTMSPYGIAGQIDSTSFDGTPAGFSSLLTSLFGGDNFQNATTHAAISGNGGLGAIVPGWVANGTSNYYNSNGLLQYTKSTSATIDTDGNISLYDTNIVTQDDYYSQTGIVPGAFENMIEDTTNASGQETFYAYDSVGHTIINYTFEQWTNATGSLETGWVGTTSVYNNLGQLTDTYQNTYGPYSLGEGLPTEAVNIPGKTFRTTDSSGDSLFFMVNGDGSVTLSYATPSGATGSEQVTGSDVPTCLYNVVISAYPIESVHTSHIDYNSLGQKIDSFDQYGNETFYTYDAQGNLIQTKNSNGTETRSVYDALGRMIWATNAFVPANDTLSSPDNTAIVTHTIYNQLGQVIETDIYENAVIEITGALNGSIYALTSQIGLDGDGDPLGTEISSTINYYDPQGHEIETIDPAGLRTASIYYPDGQVEYTGPLASSTATPTANDGVVDGDFTVGELASTASEGYTTTQDNQYSSSLNLFYSTSVDQNDHATQTYKNGAGQTVLTVYADGSFTETIYSNGNELSAIDLEGDNLSHYGSEGVSLFPANGDGLDWTSSSGIITLPSGETATIQIAQRTSGQTPVITIDLYNLAGELTDVWLPAVADALNDGTMTQPHWSYFYDQSGNEIVQADPTEQTAYQTWLGEGESFDLTHAFSGGTDFRYDQFHDQVGETLPDDESDSATFNGLGEELTATDYDGNVASYSYNSLGEVTKIIYTPFSGSSNPSQTVTYSYDDFGNQTSVSDASGTTTNYYDAFNNLVESDTPEGNIYYVFDPATQEHTETYTANTDTVYSYNSLGQLTTVTVNKLDGTTLTVPLVTSYTYDPAGNKLSETLPDGEVTDYTYDDLNRLTDVLEKQGTTTLFSQHLVLNSDGTRASDEETELQSGGSDETIASTWSYDQDQRLTYESITCSDSSQDYSDTYTYDLANNRITDVHVGPGGGSTLTTLYVYNGDDELISSGPDADHDGVPDSSTATTYIYDPNGSMTSSTTGSQVTTYTYDVRNKMVGYSDGTNTAAYVYDDVGDRVKETVGTTTTYYLTDTQNPTGYDQPVEEKSSPTATPTLTFILGDRVTGQVDSEGNVSYLLTDGHGSTRLLTNSMGIVTAAFNYDAFGTALNFNPGMASTPFLFGGDAIYDAPSGLYLHGNGVRATQGFQFIQRDTHAGYTHDPISLHEYLYANANPVNRNDPSGHFALIDDLAADAEGESFDLMNWENEGGALAQASDLEEDIEEVEDVEYQLATEVGENGSDQDLDDIIDNVRVDFENPNVGEPENPFADGGPFDDMESAVGKGDGELENVEKIGPAKDPTMQSLGFTEKWVGQDPDTGEWYSAYRNPDTGEWAGGKESSHEE
jgi:uncharacterized delta-60 repeat protein